MLWVIVCVVKHTNFPYVYGPYSSVREAMEAKKEVEKKWNDVQCDYTMYVKEVINHED